jgi:hypothetical protein
MNETGPLLAGGIGLGNMQGSYPTCRACPTSPERSPRMSSLLSRFVISAVIVALAMAALSASVRMVWYCCAPPSCTEI